MGGGGTLYPGVDCPPLPQVNSDNMFIETRCENCFQYSLEWLSETSNNQAILNPFYHNNKVKVKNLFSIDPKQRIMTEDIHDKYKHATITTKLRNVINVSLLRLK